MSKRHITKKLFIIAFPKSINVIMGSAIRGYGDTKWMLYSQIPGTIIKVSLAFIFIFVLKLGITGVLIAIFIDEGLRSLMNYIKYTRIFNNAKNGSVY